MHLRIPSIIAAGLLAVLGLVAAEAPAQLVSRAPVVGQPKTPTEDPADDPIGAMRRHISGLAGNVPEKVDELLQGQGMLGDNRGIDPFTLEWDFEISGSFLIGIDFDLAGNMVVVRQLDGGGVVIEKYDVSSNESEQLLWTLTSPFIRNPELFELDLDGNILVAGFDQQAQASEGFLVMKVSSQGFISWQRAYPTPAGVEGFPAVQDIVLDPDGVPFMIMGASSVVKDSNSAYVYQLDPVSGAVAFVIDLEQETGYALFGKDLSLALDNGGRLYALAEIDGEPKSLLTRIEGGSGRVVWSSELDMNVPPDTEADPMAALPSGGVVVVGDQLFNGQIIPWGERIDEHGMRVSVFGLPIAPPQNGTFTDVEVINDGTVYAAGRLSALGSPNGRSSGLIVSVKPDGIVGGITTFEGSSSDGPSSTLRDGFTSVGSDRIGNIYLQMRRYSGSGDRFISTMKYTAPVVGFDAQPAWVYTVGPVPGLEDNPRGLQVDGGGNVFTTSVPTFGPSFATRVAKLSQPFLGSFTVQRTNATLSFEDQSIWAPGMGNLLAEQEIFTINWDGTDASVDATFSIPVLGEFGGEFVFVTNGTLSTGVKAELNGGSVDVHLPLDVKFAIPPEGKVFPGTTVTIPVEWEADPAARITSCFTPTFNAGLTAGLDYDIFSSLRLVAFSQNLVNLNIIDDAAVFPEDYIPDANLLDILANSGYPTPGEWQSFQSPDGIFSADFRTPQLFAQGMYNQQTGSFSTSADDRFFRFGVNITEAALKPFGLTAQAQFETGTPGGEFSLSGGGAALQLGARADIGAAQDIEVGVVPMIHYNFVGENIPDQTLRADEDLVFTIPTDGSFDGVLEIIPTIMGTGAFNNMTDVGIIPGITWKSIEVNGSASAFGFDLIDIGPECILCYDWDISEILEALGVPNPDIVNLFVPVFNDGWDIPFDSVQLPCIRVLGSTNNQPNLEAASRESLGMVIYDQTSPSVSSFNVTASGSTNILLFGERFTSSMDVMIEHWGRVEALETVFVNPSTMLARVPNRFRLLPGVAKLYVQGSGLVSDTIDLAINFPVPRLDAVNPNLWAADPDLATLPISVIDAKSFAGNDTFIARRDYYIKMRDDLWNNITDDGFPGGAAEYFPAFDFNRAPDFPAVIWGAKGQSLPLPRFVQPVDNGIHNVRLAEHQYDSPMMVPVVLCNPGPGGGMSNELMLTIAAPVPVSNGVEPSEFSPDDIVFDDDYFDPDDLPVARPVEIRVTGPAHVPQFNGYEEPKYGNFNAASVVRFNGMDLPTTFVSSSLLIAQIPPEDVVLGDHYVTVFTPSNGTQYFEELWADSNMDGVRDDVPVFQGLVDSGGESAPLLFRVRYREPEIRSTEPAIIDVASVVFDDAALGKVRPYNFTVIGENFRDGAQAYFNGQARVTLVEGANKIRVKLLPEDVAFFGDFELIVQNPNPDFAASAPFMIPIRDLQLIPAKGP